MGLAVYPLTLQPRFHTMAGSYLSKLFNVHKIKKMWILCIICWKDMMWCRLRGYRSKQRLEVNKPANKITADRATCNCSCTSASIGQVACSLETMKKCNDDKARSRQWKKLISHVSWMLATSEFILQICSLYNLHIKRIFWYKFNPWSNTPWH